MRRKLKCFVFLATSLAASIALGHGGATGIVKERMDQMDAVSKAMKTLNAMLKERIPFNAAEAARLANEVSGNGGKVLTRLFPEGTLDKPTEALPAIWNDWPRFEALANEMELSASRLAETLRVSSEAPEDFKVQFRTLAQTCKSCHDDFRLEK